MNRRCFVRIGIVSIAEVLPHIVLSGKPPHGDPKKIKTPRPEKEFLGQPIYMDSLRCQTFKKSGTVCVHCKLEGAYFAVERREEETRFQLNLYGLIGLREILFTKDHIVPRSRQGEHHLENLQTMCSPCNNLKDSADTVDPTRNRNMGRIKSLQNKIARQIGKINEESKKVRQKDAKDGGPEYRALRQRRLLLIARNNRLSKIREKNLQRQEMSK